MLLRLHQSLLLEVWFPARFNPQTYSFTFNLLLEFATQKVKEADHLDISVTLSLCIDIYVPFIF